MYPASRLSGLKLDASETIPLHDIVALWLGECAADSGEPSIVRCPIRPEFFEGAEVFAVEQAAVLAEFSFSKPTTTRIH